MFLKTYNENCDLNQQFCLKMYKYLKTQLHNTISHVPNLLGFFCELEAMI